MFVTLRTRDARACRAAGAVPEALVVVCTPRPTRVLPDALPVLRIRPEGSHVAESTSSKSALAFQGARAVPAAKSDARPKDAGRARTLLSTVGVERTERSRAAATDAADLVDAERARRSGAIGVSLTRPGASAAAGVVNAIVAEGAVAIGVRTAVVTTLTLGRATLHTANRAVALAVRIAGAGRMTLARGDTLRPVAKRAAPSTTSVVLTYVTAWLLGMNPAHRG